MKVQLKEICKIHGGIAAPKQKEAFSSEGIPFVRMKDLGQYHLTSNLIETSELLDFDYIKDKRLKTIPKGSILLPRSGSVSLNHRAVLGADAIIVSHICALEVTSKKVNNLYLYYYLIVRNIDNIIKRTTGLDAVTFNDLGNLYVDIPPIKVQDYFVSSLQIIERIVQKRRQTIELLDQLVKVVFLDMFGDPYYNQKKWKKTTLKKVITDSQYGTSKKSNSEGVGLPVLRMNNITSYGEVDLTNIKWTQYAKGEKDKYLLKVNDLLFNRTNSRELVGKTAVWTKKCDYTFAGYLVRFRFIKDINPFYVSEFLNSNYGKQLLFHSAMTAGNQANISPTRLKQLSILMPPIELQNKFEVIIITIRKIKDTLKNNLQSSENLFQSLLQKAFKGELEFEKEKILEDILPNLRIEELLADFKLLNTFLEKLNNQDFKTGSNYKLAQNLLFQLLDNEKSGLYQQYDVETENLEIKHEAN